MNKIKTGLNKIKDIGGESLAETLVASLIGGLALLMLAQMLTAASGMIRSSQETMKDYIDEENTLNAGGPSTDSGSVQFTIINADGSLKNMNIASQNAPTVNYYTNGNVISYETKQ